MSDIQESIHLLWSTYYFNFIKILTTKKNINLNWKLLTINPNSNYFIISNNITYPWIPYYFSYNSSITITNLIKLVKIYNDTFKPQINGCHLSLKLLLINENFDPNIYISNKKLIENIFTKKE